jgi:hypothetical protein
MWMLPTSACALEDTGVVEFNWAVVDRDGDAIFPAGQFMASGDTCDMPATLGGASVRYDLHVELEICDQECAGGCDDPDCLVVPTSRNSCTVARVTDRDVPASSDAYLFTMRAVISLPDGDCVDFVPPCIAVPGPRERPVHRGLVTDLQVFQVVVNSDVDADDPLDLEACGCA